MPNFSNQDIAKLLRSVAAALSLGKGSIFQVRAYENAADGIEHLTSEVKDLWQEGKLDDIPGVGENIQGYLDELFKRGEVKHFNSLTKKFDPFLFDLLDVPGVGPKTALELSKLGLKSFKQLKEWIKTGQLQNKGFSAKISEKIMNGLSELEGRSGRMLLPYATAQAEKILEYLKKGPGVKGADPLGSLRRKVATIGDLDFAACGDDPQAIIDYFVKMEGVVDITDQGENKAAVVLNSGLHVDLLVGKPDTYGALLQHFTGSKHHNIKLRTLALKMGLSLSEYGVKKVTKVTKAIKLGNEGWIPCDSEEELYKLLGMDTPAPEIREDFEEIEAALAHKLPKLVEFRDIKGDLHLHSNFPMERPSHGPGADSMKEIVEKAESLGYEYVGISDHPPGFRVLGEKEIEKIIAKRTSELKEIKESTKSIRVLNGLEVDILPDGTLSVPNSVLETLDYCIGGIHSGHRGSKEDITKRILKALENPFVSIISHPTGRLLNERESYEADWPKIFEYCGKNHKILEINGYPNRLDLRDDLVREALKYGVKFIIDTDAHEISQMENMPYGVSVARRGWAEAKDIVNSWDWKKLAEWFNIKS